MNYVQKILARQGLGVETGQFVRIRPRHILTHDNSSAVMAKWASISPNPVIADRSQPVLAIDHDIQNPAQTDKYSKISEFARKYSLDYYPPHSGIGHQIIVEQGYAFPNEIVVASDSHSNMYGGVGCLGKHSLSC